MFDQRFGGMTVKASHRFALPAASLAAALIATTAPAVARAQRGQAPGPDTPRILVTNFRGDREAGVKIADEVRDRKRLRAMLAADAAAERAAQASAIAFLLGETAASDAGRDLPDPYRDDAASDADDADGSA